MVLRQPITPEETAAREELSAVYGHALDDAEWADIQLNLSTVFGVLLEWQCGVEDRSREEIIEPAIAVK